MTWRDTQLKRLREALTAAVEGAGSVYLLHFDEPVKGPTQHYTGWTRRLSERLADHAYSGGSSMTVAAYERGICFTVAATFAPAGPLVEKTLKPLARFVCPLCGDGFDGIVSSTTPFRLPPIAANPERYDARSRPGVAGPKGCLEGASDREDNRATGEAPPTRPHRLGESGWAPVQRQSKLARTGPLRGTARGRLAPFRGRCAGLETGHGDAVKR